MKKILSMALLLAIVASSAFAAGKPSLTVWLKKEVNETTNAMLEARAREFGKLNNIDLTVELIPYEKLYPMWMSAIEAKTLPDVSYFQYQEAGQFYAQNLMLDSPT